MRLKEIVASCLQSQPGEWFTVHQVAHLVIRRFPDHFAAKAGRSARLQSEEDIFKQVRAEIFADKPGILKRYPDIETTERPIKLRWRLPNQHQ